MDGRQKLRADAEARFARDPPAKASSRPSSKLLHELQVHQIELEMQNEELRRTQLALQVSRDRYLELYDFAPVGYLTVSEDGLIQDANLAVASMLGVDRGKLPGRPFAAFVSRPDADRWHLIFSGRDAGAGPLACDLRLRRNDGTTFHAHLACHGPAAGGAAPSSARIALTDVTASKQLEQALRESAARLSYVLAGSNDGFWDWDIPSGHVRFSGRWAGMLGYDVSELEPSLATWERLIHPDDAGGARASIDAHLRGKTEQFEHELRARHKDGRWIWILDRGRVVERDPGGGAVRMAGTHTDITARKQAEAALQASETRFRALADGAPVGIFETDAEGRNVYLNRMGEAIVGISREEARGRGWHDSIHPEDRERVLREWNRTLETGEIFTSEYRFQRKGGASILARGYATAVRAPDGPITGYIGVVMDVTEGRAMEQQLALASRLTAMGTLVAGVAHEINNPLAAELAGQGLALEIARDTRTRLREDAPLDREAGAHDLDDVIDALEDAQEGGRRIASIVRDLATFASPDPRRARVRLADVVEDAMRWLPASVASQASIEVESLAGPDVMASAGQIAQVLVNLVSNAAKATPAGKRGEIRIRTGPGGPGLARLEVVDHGSGIDPAIMARIFEPFFTTRQVGEGRGAGLGLAISHAIVIAHGGTLTVTSVVGSGSTFRVELPVAAAES